MGSVITETATSRELGGSGAAPGPHRPKAFTDILGFAARREPTGSAIASARNHNKRFTRLAGRTIEEIVQLSGLLARATIIVSLKMQGYVE